VHILGPGPPPRRAVEDSTGPQSHDGSGGRAAQFTVSFDSVVSDAGIQDGKISRGCLRANRCAERFVPTRELSSPTAMLIFGEPHLRSVLAYYVRYCTGRRPHRARELRPARPDHSAVNLYHRRITCRPVLGRPDQRIRKRGISAQIRAFAEFWNQQAGTEIAFRFAPPLVGAGLPVHSLAPRSCPDPGFPFRVYP
jgi:hypothetical protein